MCFRSALVAPSLSMAITFPSMNSERLMFAVSLAIVPSLLLAFKRSEPARSMNDTLPNLLTVMPSRSTWLSTCTVMMECERDESLFSSCDPTCLFLVPVLTTASASSSRVHSTVLSPGTWNPRPVSMRSESCVSWSPVSKS